MTVSVSQVAVGVPGPRCVRYEGPAVGAGNVVGTFVVPAGVSVLFVTGVAPGAGGGGGASPTGPGGGGGGSGSFVVRWPIFVQSGEVLTITLPPPTAGGAAGAASAGASSLTITSSLGAATRIAPRLASGNTFALAGGGTAGAGSGTTGGSGGSSGILTGNTTSSAGAAGNAGALIDISGGMYHGRHVSAHSGGAATFGCPAQSQSIHPGYVGPTTGDATNGGGGHGAWTPFGRGGQGGNGGSAGAAPLYGYGAGGGGGGGSAAGGAGGRAFLELAW